jgi:NAD(P)-dependent dehydrogenase (short-subunit alcohol dehydrogenase family)
MQPWALVSPASRGIGLELARRLLQTTKVPIVATARKDLDQTRENILQGLDGVSEDRLHVLKIDVLGRCLALSMFWATPHYIAIT